jgi:hypothetical protein
MREKGVWRKGLGMPCPAGAAVTAGHVKKAPSKLYTCRQPVRKVYVLSNWERL